MRFSMEYFWPIQDWISDLPDQDIQQFTTYIVTKGTSFVIECDDEKLLNYMMLRWGNLIDNRNE